MQLQQPEKSFLQGLIQLTVALHHFQNANPAGAISLLKRALRRFEACPGCFGGVDVASLSAEMRAWLLAIESQAALPFPVPQICLVDQARR